MKKQLSLSHPIFLYGLPLLLISMMVALVNSPVFFENPQPLSQAVTLDLILTLPLLWFILIRKTDISKTTVISVFGLGILIATFLLPQEHQSLLNAAKHWILPLFEIGITVFLFAKIRTTWKTAKATAVETFDFYDALKLAVKENLPKRIAPIFITEIAVPYYAFFNWKKHFLQANEYSYHRRNGIREVLGAFGFIILIETFAVHFMLQSFSPILAWILTLISIYTGLQIFALIRSLPKRPIVIKGESVFFRFGFMGDVIVKIEDIQEIELTRKSFKSNEHVENISPVGELNNHNILIHLKKEYILNSVYGMKKKFQILALHLDDKEGFKNAIEDKLNSRK